MLPAALAGNPVIAAGDEKESFAGAAANAGKVKAATTTAAREEFNFTAWPFVGCWS